MVNVAIIGSTGSIGTQVLNVIARYPDKFRVSVIVACSNIDLLIKQYYRFNPDFVAIFDEKASVEAASFLPKEKLISGKDALTFASFLPQTDIIVVSVSGMIGLLSVEAAIKNNKKIALANKESLVAGGDLVNRLLKEHDSAKIIPIDSEHSAIMQCLQAGEMKDVRRLILTASGGPFYGMKKNDLKNVTPEQAIKHPNWNMGRKISVDSATMMNKALEIIEARYLFDITEIEYTIHRESIVHSMVEFNDGSIIAQLGRHNMEIPIQYALSLPTRLPTGFPPLNLTQLTFKEPDEIAFPAPRLAKYCLEKGLDYCCRFNAANEACVSLFFQGKIGFTDIYDVVEDNIIKSKGQCCSTIEELFDCYNETVKEIISRY